MEASAVREEKEQGTGILLQDAKNLGSGIAATCWLRTRRGAACRVGPTSSLEISWPAYALFTGLGLEGLVALDLQRIPYELQVLRSVFHDQNQLIRHKRAGIVNVNVEPSAT
jgi:hypothetical protein